VTCYQVTSEKDAEQYHRSYNFKWKIQRRRCTVATQFNDSHRYAFRVQTFAVSCATCFCNDHQQSTRTSLQVCGLNLENPCFSHRQLYVACSRVGKPSDLFVYSIHQKEKQKILYIQKLFNKQN
jgi:hypothetical protein